MVQLHETYLIMESKELKEFKKNVGQSNHYLITLLIGLDAVKNGYKKPDYLDSKWDPENLDNSVNRTKIYSFRAAMAWLGDNVDTYFSSITSLLRKLNPSSDLLLEIDFSNVHSVHKVFTHFKDKSSDKIGVEYWAYVDMLIQWRNNLTHKNASNSLIPEASTYFNSNKSGIIKSYKGKEIDIHLDTKKLLNDFKDNETITLKDIATLISKTIQYITKLDNLIMEQINPFDYYDYIIYKIEKKAEKDKVKKTDLQKVFENIKGKETKTDKMRRYMRCLGFPREKYNNIDDYIKDVSPLTYNDFKSRINNKFSS